MQKVSGIMLFKKNKQLELNMFTVPGTFRCTPNVLMTNLDMLVPF